MAIELLSSSIPNLINGVSQQPPALRLPSQAQSQLNGLSSVVNGLSKRPNTQLIKKLGTYNELQNCFIHTMQRDNNEFYILVISTTNVRVFDQYGVERTVSGTASYLSGLTNPATELSATTVNDYTFIVNKTKTVADQSYLTNTRNPEALVYLKKGDYNCKYQIKITKGTVNYLSTVTTMSSTQSSTALTQNAEASIRTDTIINDLKTFNGTTGNPSNITMTEYGNVIHYYN